jgi:hypothetical protein
LACTPPILFRKREKRKISLQIERPTDRIFECRDGYVLVGSSHVWCHSGNVGDELVDGVLEFSSVLVRAILDNRPMVPSQQEKGSRLRRKMRFGRERCSRLAPLRKDR